MELRCERSEKSGSNEKARPHGREDSRAENRCARDWRLGRSSDCAVYAGIGEGLDRFAGQENSHGEEPPLSFFCFPCLLTSTVCDQHQSTTNNRSCAYDLRSITVARDCCYAIDRIIVLSMYRHGASRRVAF